MLEPAQGKKEMFIFCPFDFLFGHIINILLTELGRSVWKNLDLGRWYRPHCVRSVLATSVKILPYRPPARLIRTKSYFEKRTSRDRGFFFLGSRFHSASNEVDKKRGGEGRGGEEMG